MSKNKQPRGGSQCQSQHRRRPACGLEAAGGICRVGSWLPGQAGHLALQGQVFADNLLQPKAFTLTVSIAVTETSLSVDELCSLPEETSTRSSRPSAIPGGSRGSSSFWHYGTQDIVRCSGTQGIHVPGGTKPSQTPLHSELSLHARLTACCSNTQATCGDRYRPHG